MKTKLIKKAKTAKYADVGRGLSSFKGKVITLIKKVCKLLSFKYL